MSKKTLTLMVHLTFEGDYYSADEVADAAEQWIDAGLDDRDDLRGWVVTAGPVVEEEIKPVEAGTPTRGEVFKEAAEFVRAIPTPDPWGSNFYELCGLARAADELENRAAGLLLEEP